VFLCFLSFCGSQAYFHVLRIGPIFYGRKCLRQKCFDSAPSTERAKIFVEKFFALEVGLGREELQGIQGFLVLFSGKKTIAE